MSSPEPVPVPLDAVSATPADPLIDRVTAGVLALIRDGAATGAVQEAGLVRLVRGAARDIGVVLGLDDVLAVTARVGAELWGLGPLQPLVERPGVTDVLVNGPGEVWIDDGAGLRREDCRLDREEDVRALAVRLAAAAGRRLDEAVPWVDARLPGGLRLHAVLPPVAPTGTLISVRVLGRAQADLDALVAAGSVPAGWLPLLDALVRRRLSFLVSGGTGAGKTTLLAALLARVPRGERVVLVEDVGELRPQHPHVVRLEARHANVEGRGAVELADLVRQALRMRPDRIVVGECRGTEVRDLLAALNTGHAGGCGTVHANAPADVPARLEALAAPAGMTPAAVRTQVVSALDALVHVERRGDRRRVAQVAVIERVAGEPVVLEALGRDDATGATTTGPGWPLLARRLGLALDADAPAASVGAA